MILKLGGKSLITKVLRGLLIILFLSIALVLILGEKAESVSSAYFQAYPPPENEQLPTTVNPQSQAYPAPGQLIPTNQPSGITTRSLLDNSLEKQFHGVPHKTMALVKSSSSGHVLNIERGKDLPKPNINSLPTEVPLVYPQGNDAFEFSKELASINSPQTPLTVPAQINNIDATQMPLVNLDGPIYYNVSYEAIQQLGYPPDCNIAVGPSDLLAIVNFKFAFYDKSNPGNLLSQVDFTTWYAGMVLFDTGVFDPRVIYDPWNSRFIVITAGKNMRTQQSQFLVSVSQQPSVIGNWLTYSFDASIIGNQQTLNWADRPNMVSTVIIYI